MSPPPSVAPVAGEVELRTTAEERAIEREQMEIITGAGGGVGLAMLDDIDTLLAHLAARDARIAELERDSLRRETRALQRSNAWRARAEAAEPSGDPAFPFKGQREDYERLTAPSPSVAPVADEVERSAFEAWCGSYDWGEKYAVPYFQVAWDAWQARSAHSHPPLAGEVELRTTAKERGENRRYLDQYPYKPGSTADTLSRLIDDIDTLLAHLAASNARIAELEAQVHHHSTKAGDEWCCAEAAEARVRELEARLTPTDEMVERAWKCWVGAPGHDTWTKLRAALTAALTPETPR